MFVVGVEQMSVGRNSEWSLVDAVALDEHVFMAIYPRMPIGKVCIYRLLFAILFVCLFRCLWLFLAVHFPVPDSCCLCVQISDLHLSVFYDRQRVTELRQFCQETLMQVITPEVVLVTGKYTHENMHEVQWPFWTIWYWKVSDWCKRFMRLIDVADTQLTGIAGMLLQSANFLS